MKMSVRLTIEIFKKIIEKNSFDEFQKLNAPYDDLFEKVNHPLGLPGIWGIANGSINTIIDNNFIFFNFLP